MMYATYAALAFWCLWVLFLAVMNLGQAKAEGKLRGFNLYAGYTVLAVGLLVDLFVQVFVASILWLELPRELTVSERVARLCKDGKGWQKKLALWFRTELLSPFDRSGGHG
jgi:hypothetical protein